MDLNQVVQIDLGKYPVKIILAVVVLLLTFLASFGERSYAEELNKLPRNRTELTSIKSVEIFGSENDPYLINVKLIIDFIYEITFFQHLKFLRLEIVGNGVTYKLNTSFSTTHPQVGKELFLSFRSPISGPIRAELYRSKTLLKSENFNIQQNDFDSKTSSPANSVPHFSTGVSCSNQWNGTNDLEKDLPQNRKCSFSDICLKTGVVYWFSQLPFYFQDPLIQFNQIQNSIRCQSSPQQNINDFLHRIETAQLLENEALVVGIPDYYPYQWEWMSKVASLTESAHHNITYVMFGNQNDQAMQYYNRIDKNIFLIKNDVYCLKAVSIKQLEKNDKYIYQFRQNMLKGISSQNTENMVITLVSNSSSFIVKNLAEIAQSICKECEHKNVVVEEYNEITLIEMLYKAKYVISPYSECLSQSFWMRGTLIEIMPKGCESIQWPFEPTKYAKVKHIRVLAEDNQIELFTNKSVDSDFDESKIESLLNQTITVPADKLRSIISS